MADTPKSKEKIGDDLALSLRRAVNNAYAFVRGRETAQSFSCVTFEDLAAQQVERLNGKESATRSNEIHQIQKVKEAIISAVNCIENLPPDAFRIADEKKDVNTAP